MRPDWCEQGHQPGEVAKQLGVSSDVPVGLTFNSQALGTSAASPYDYAGQGWDLSPNSARLGVNTDGSVTYTTSSGRTGLFLPVAGSTTAYTSKVSLVRTSTGWTLTRPRQPAEAELRQQRRVGHLHHGPQR